MGEFGLRWKARIGALKPLAVIVALLAVVLFFVAVSSLLTALKNPSEPEVVEIGQLVSGEIGTNRYVIVSGTAEYETGYTEEEDGRTVAEYYFLFDDRSGNIVLVKTEQWIQLVEYEHVTITGMTRRIPSDLRPFVEEDLALIHDAGLETTTTLYVAENQKPPGLLGALLGTIFLAGVLFACGIIFLFPKVVFAPSPIDLAAPSSDAPPGIKATGQFLKLKNPPPNIEIGRGKRKFEKAVANLVPLAERNLMVYIHNITRVKTYGVTVSRQETDWGLFLDANNVVSIESGTLYGWKSRPAVRARYQDEKGKVQTLIVSFDHASAQATVVRLLQKLGFAVGVGA